MERVRKNYRKIIICVVVAVTLFVAMNLSYFATSYATERERVDYKLITTQIWCPTWVYDYYTFYTYDADPYNKYLTKIDRNHDQSAKLKYSYFVSKHKTDFNLLEDYELYDVFMQIRGNTLNFFYKTSTPLLDLNGVDIFYKIDFRVLNDAGEVINNNSYYSEIREDNSDNLGKQDSESYNLSSSLYSGDRFDYFKQQVNVVNMVRDTLTRNNVVKADTVNSMSIQEMVKAGYLEIELNEIWFSPEAWDDGVKI